MENLIDTDRAEHLGQILEMFMRGHQPKYIGTALKIDHRKVQRTLTSFKKDYLSCLSLNGIIPRYSDLNDAIDEINEPFYKLMSRSDQALSNEEMVYCSLVVSTGNSVKAVVDSGLDVGLVEATKEIYKKNCILRSEMLKRKRNIQEEIRRLQKEREEYRETTKERLIDMQMTYLEQLQEDADPKNKSLIVKLFDQVNKLTGSYTTVIKTSEVSADDVLDGMLATFAEEQEKAEQESLSENFTTEEEHDEQTIQ